MPTECRYTTRVTPFIDFNNNGTHDGPDGAFNGSLCEGPLCSTTQNIGGHRRQQHHHHVGQYGSDQTVGTPSLHACGYRYAVNL